MKPPRVASLLLRLYPRSFREEYGSEALKQLAADLTAGGRHPRGLGRRLVLLADFALSGIGARLDTMQALASPSFWLGWGQDVRLALRTAVTRPGFSVIAIASLTVGIAANVSMFSLVDALLLRSIPGVDQPDRVVEIGLTRANSSNFGSWDYPDFLDLRREAPLAAVALFETSPVGISDADQGERILAMFTTSGYFDVMGLQPEMGRYFLPDEDTDPGLNPVVVLSHRMWVDRFESAPDILGRPVRLNRESYTVVGVAPASFRGHQFATSPAIYLPITQYRTARDAAERFFGSRGTTWAGVVGRLPSDVPVEELNAALATIFDGLAAAYPDSNQGRSARAATASLAPADARTAMSIMFGLIGALMLLVLAATCANVGGMLLARASARGREMAVRAALGSGRARLVRHLVTESMVIFAIGGLAGIVLATRLVQSVDLNSLLPTPFPVTLDLAIDWRVVSFGIGLTLATGLLFGLLPALQVARHDLATTLRDHAAGSGRRAGRIRKFFVAGQVAVSLLLLGSAGLFVRSVQTGISIDPGFVTEGIHLTSLDLALEGYDDAESANSFVSRVLEELAQVPDLAGATVASDMPLDGGTSSTPVWPDGRADEDAPSIQSYFGHVSAGYFDALGIPLLRGREFEAIEGPTTERVAVVNERFAEIAWPQAQAIGRTIEFGLDPKQYTVVGVVANTKSDMITDGTNPQVFSLLAQDFEPDVIIAARQTGTAVDFATRVQQVLLGIDPALALARSRKLSDLAGLGMLPHRIGAWMATSLGLLALFLSALGLYGVVALAVTQRTREIGVRIALGAKKRQVLARVLLSGLSLAAPGIVVGIVLTIALGQVVDAFLLGVDALDPLTYATVSALLLVVIVAACIVPARRASSVQPMEALRYD